ncbi:wd repeat-containing protein 66-like protein [Histomonas meleagridis]|uniref:wd repeat-containing protein 66-like protein n=1 Tax=Histomonas meleagridis TaxID=135588 RepID=UPI0035596D6D|nr:wd repeat-containing protein 66-like protein [Histomonas meleagridis]KAH0802799.1 wd repeat-containing protein 66-like protein [Histomonas meleagridis]
MSARPLEQSALSLEWVLGANTSIINGVIDLKDDQRDCFFYPCAHTGVLFNCENNTQTLFLGHRHTITAVAVTQDKNYIATGDTGDNSALIVWDSHTACPLFTKFSPHSNGVCACAFSQSGKYLATLSSNTNPQIFAIWDWNSNASSDPEPAVIVEIPFPEQMKCVQFNPRDETQLITNGSHSIIFWQWNTSNDNITYYSPPVTSRDLKKPIGNLTYSRYLPENDDVIISTSEGSIIQLIRDPFALHQGLESEHKPVKIINLHKSSIQTLEIHENYIVTGGSDGFVKFYDFQFRLIAWFEDIKAGPITSISFATTSHLNNTTDKSKFVCQPFIVATSNASVIRITDAVFYSVLGTDQPKVLLMNHTGNVKAMAVNPNDGRIATGSDLGELIQWDIVNHTPINRACYDKMQISALCYVPSEDFLAIGFTNGSIFIVTTENFDDVYHQRIAKNVPIRNIQYSSDSLFMAITMEDNTLALFRSLDKLSPTTPMMSQPHENDDVQMTTIQQEMKKWEYVGRHKAHWDKITGLSFIGNGSTESPHRLFTIGKDRRIVEYDFANSTYLDGVLLKMQTQIEMTAKPVSFIWIRQDNRWFFIVANTEGKLRLWNGATMICSSTTLAPSFGGDLIHMIFVDNSKQKSIIYSTDSCILGIVLYPLTGNPNESMGLIAHPLNIENILMSRDQSRVLVYSGVDNYIGIFTSNPENLEAAALLAARDGDPFIQMLEGGEDGPLYQEIVDYFYSSQLRVQGKLTDKAHEIPQVVPISEVVPLMCALGFYPTQFEADLIRNEIQYSKFLETNEKTETIDFQTFLRLFLNHRPAVPPSLDDIEKAFKVLGADENGFLSTEELIKLLQSSGEPMSSEDIEKCFEILVGQQLPSQINSSEFVETVLGLMSEEEEEMLETKRDDESQTDIE